MENYEVRITAANSGAEMRARIANKQFDLIVLDLRLPDADGASLVREARRTSDVPIVMLTGLHEKADRVMCLQLGAYDYVTKPFSSRELLARIRARLRRASMQQPLVDALAAIFSYRFLRHRLRELVDVDVDVRAHLDRVDVPVLHLHATEDLVVPAGSS